MINRYASLRQGLVGAWCPSLGASGFRLIDRSGYNNHGVLTGMDPGTDWVPSGGKLALDFDGVNDYVTIPRSIAVTSDFSISIWVLGNSANVIGQGDGQRPATGFYLQITSGFVNIVSDYVSSVFYTGSIALDANKMNHIVLVKRSGSVSVSVNGRLDTAGGALPATDVTSTIYVGRVLFNNTFFYAVSKIDDIRIYNRALTPSEINLLYTGGRGVGLAPERIKHRRKTSAAATNRRRRIICGANC